MSTPEKRAPKRGERPERPPTLSEDFVALLGEFEAEQKVEEFF